MQVLTYIFSNFGQVLMDGNKILKNIEPLEYIELKKGLK